jgi:hypothetical protein
LSIPLSRREEDERLTDAISQSLDLHQRLEMEGCLGKVHFDSSRGPSTAP